MSEKKPHKDTDNTEYKSEKRDAFDAALKYLAAAPRSEKEVRGKLYGKGFRRAEIDEAIARAKQYRYIDDESYAAEFAETYGARYGRKKVEYRLVYEKGVPPDVAAAAVRNILDDESEEEKACAAAKKFAASKKTDGKKDAAKIAAFLYRKGFDAAVINRAVSAVYADADIPFDAE